MKIIRIEILKKGKGKPPATYIPDKKESSGVDMELVVLLLMRAEITVKKEK